MIVLDASVLIAHIGEQDPHARDALEILDTEKEDLAIHALTLAEVLVGAVQQSQAAELLRLFEIIGITTLPMTEADALLLAELRARTRLKMPDCCVLLAARTEGAAVATFDTRLAETAHSLGIRVHGARPVSPPAVGRLE